MEDSIIKVNWFKVGIKLRRLRWRAKKAWWDFKIAWRDAWESDIDKFCRLTYEWLDLLREKREREQKEFDKRMQIKQKEIEEKYYKKRI